MMPSLTKILLMLPKIIYLPDTHQLGFRHYLKHLIPSFAKAVRNRIKKIFNK